MTLELLWLACESFDSCGHSTIAQPFDASPSFGEGNHRELNHEELNLQSLNSLQIRNYCNEELSVLESLGLVLLAKGFF